MLIALQIISTHVCLPEIKLSQFARACHTKVLQVHFFFLSVGATGALLRVVHFVLISVNWCFPNTTDNSGFTFPEFVLSH